jgi:hypothetical protein
MSLIVLSKATITEAYYNWRWDSRAMWGEDLTAKCDTRLAIFAVSP